MTRSFIVSACVTDADLAVPELARPVIAAAEAAGLDLLMLGRAGARPFDAQVLAAWAAPLTSRTAIVATVPASNAHPFHVARALSAVDFLADGRTGWSVIAEDAEPGAAADMVRAARALWDGWGADTLVIDKESGVYLNPDQVVRPNYRGPFFDTAGPVNAMRPLQGQPVLVLDEAAPIGIDDADVVLVDAPDAAAESARRLLKIAPGAEVDSAALAASFDTGEIDGVHFMLTESAAALPAAIAAIGALLADRPGTVPAITGTLRERLGLALPQTASTQAKGAFVPEYVA
ncbi:LLM class flavin-dependent oxidoreductase [Novosphingobium sp. ERN07]|uniref:LLM class flavin-dependent oxidoreductase n=1 Tax=Novosphingobium sp. ERN07 TaxID=2726187 RepID=UPI0014578DDF|nr:LLM class flavin-dependent oxidoreductase [Novosphingobium sp. ERN07]NLR70376.1 LLM class flavin-dependent oxidoreductase [Novosphingobium sp. ERN07]